MKTFKILGLLLSYPKDELIENLAHIEQILKSEAILPKGHLKRITRFIDYMKHTDIYQLQEDYVSLFDRGRAHCLHLFEHIHGESRDRGQAMVNLQESYAARGFYISQGELPDYLPLFLEYLSFCPAEEAVDLIGDPINVIATIAIRLKKRESQYHIVFDAISALAKVKPDAALMAQAKASALKNQTLEELDKEWAETEAFDNAPDCGSCEAAIIPPNNPAKFAQPTKGVH